MSVEQRRAAQRATRARAAALGIACMHEMAGPDISGEDDVRTLLDLAAAEAGPQVVAYWGELGGVDTARSLGARGAAGDLFVDGAIGSRTALLRTPYADDPTTSGAAYVTADAVAEHLVACTRAGLQGGFHVIGDAAADTVVAGLLAAEGVLGADRIRASRHRLEHVELVDADQIAVLARLGVFASMQPVFDALWGGGEGMYATRLGASRASTMNRFADLAGAGVADGLRV